MLILWADQMIFVAKDYNIWVSLPGELLGHRKLQFLVPSLEFNTTNQVHLEIASFTQYSEWLT